MLRPIYDASFSKSRSVSWSVRGRIVGVDYCVIAGEVRDMTRLKGFEKIFKSLTKPPKTNSARVDPRSRLACIPVQTSRKFRGKLYFAVIF